MSLYFFTIHDETGKRVDDESDFPMTLEKLESWLKYESEGEVIIDGLSYHRHHEHFIQWIEMED